MTYKELARALPDMSQQEVLDGIRSLEDAVFISAEMAGRACGLGGNSVRMQAREDQETGINRLGFRCIVAGRRVIVNRKSFLDYVEGGTA